jgi:asparagine synthase (glutamine-hydrolysing)
VGQTGIERAAIDDEHTTLHGWSPRAPVELLDAILRGEPEAVHGDFTIGGRTLDGRHYLMSSPLCARPYYWSKSATGDLVHGATVFDVVRSAGLSWRWNRRAIQHVAAFEHPLGTETIHPSVFRIAPGSIVYETTAGISERRWFDERAWFRGRESGGVSLAQAVAVLESVFREMPRDNPWLSLSAGFDSRVLLAAMLADDRRPQCACMGRPDSTDVVVAGRIAERLGLPFSRIDIETADYLRFGREATRVTSGGKSSRHYHTYIFAQKLGLGPADRHFVGSNGEFARTFYFDAGPLAQLVDKGPGFPVRLLAHERIRSRTRGSAVLDVLGGSREQLARDFAKLAPSVGTPLDRLDLLYAYQRVRHLIGHGLAMYAEASAVHSPFLDVRWMQAVAALDRTDKLGGNYPRAALARLAPQLLAFPRETESRPVQPRAPWSYPLQRRPPGVDYAPHRELCGVPEVIERVIDSSVLDELVERRDRESAAQRRDAPLVQLLLTLSWAAELGHDAARAGGG